MGQVGTSPRTNDAPLRGGSTGVGTSGGGSTSRTRNSGAFEFFHSVEVAPGIRNGRPATKRPQAPVLCQAWRRGGQRGSR